VRHRLALISIALGLVLILLDAVVGATTADAAGSGLEVVHSPVAAKSAVLALGKESYSGLRPASSECGFYGAPYGPSGAVYDYLRDEVFVADSETNAIYVIAAGNLTLVRVISLGGVCVNPFGLAYDPSLNEVFVAEAGNAAVAAISDLTNTVVATYPIPGQQPWNIAVDTGLDELFVTDEPESNIAVLSLSSGAPVVSISENRTAQPIGLSYDAELGEVFVANSLGDYTDTVSVISDSSNSIVASVPVGCVGPGTAGTWPENPFGTLFDPATGNVYVSCLIGGGLAVISASNHRETAYISLNDSSTALALDPDRGVVWTVSPFSGEAYVVSDTNNSVNHQEATGGFPFEGLAIDNRTGDAFVPNFKSSNVTVLSPEAIPIGSIALPSAPAPEPLLVWSPPSVWVIVFGMTGIVVLVTAVVAFRFRSTKPPRP
jgi:DNA-binding beta-propeller fold protein YncE